MTEHRASGTNKAVEDGTNLRLEGIQLMTDDDERALSFASLIGLVAGDEGKLTATEALLALWQAKFSEFHKHRRALIFFSSTFRCYQFGAGILAHVDRRVRVL